MTKDNKEREPASKTGTFMAIGAGVGVAIGAGIGAAIDNVGLGIAIGIAIGPGMGAAMALATQQQKNGDEGRD